MSTPPKRQPPRPPLKGSFPLDHFHDCSRLALEYEACLRAHSSVTAQCRDLAKTYLECRMENNLMLPADAETLGFNKEGTSNIDTTKATVPEQATAGAFVAGLRKD
ncbi:Cytochrome c oxidase assembly protein COX19 [Porphyridium purpureum]|uniref:Cytochrome c oxidase assembly protein COX19 n=1 Tax=Porphyridium purpureum TaxID=35688 RepID=A0A5J4YK90_PORPP|nr:Cytochrome c oxidase assembly protein COX19 [Porphyridium purpureum]|eukprot:POR4567..scf210_14